MLLYTTTAAAAALSPFASDPSTSVQYGPPTASVEAARAAYYNSHSTHNTTYQKRAPNGGGAYMCNAPDWQGICT